MSLLFFISFFLVPIGLIFTIQHWAGGSILFIMGFLGLNIYSIIKTIKNFEIIRNNKFILLLYILIPIMPITFFSKYLYFRFWDYPTLLIVPIFVLLSLNYLISEKHKDKRIVSILILFLVLIIPLFGFDFDRAPRRFYPKEWYDRYNVTSSVPIRLPYSIKYNETKELYAKAFKLKQSEKYFESIPVYQEALKIEPKNPQLLFDLSESYANINDLETAVSILDTAIMIDDSFYGFYNNRGLLYYKLDKNEKAIEDYNKAIMLDSSHYSVYCNLSLVYYDKRMFDKVCELITKAEKLGFNCNSNKQLRRIKRKSCR